jgi:hypothetical protein
MNYPLWAAARLQVGGWIGLAVLGTVAWSAVADNIRSQAAAADASITIGDI